MEASNLVCEFAERDCKCELEESVDLANSASLLKLRMSCGETLGSATLRVLATTRAVACDIFSAHFDSHGDTFQPLVSRAKQQMCVCQNLCGREVKGRCKDLDVLF